MPIVLAPVRVQGQGASDGDCARDSTDERSERRGRSDRRPRRREHGRPLGVQRAEVAEAIVQSRIPVSARSGMNGLYHFGFRCGSSRAYAFRRAELACRR
jgi:hypothetical protein